MSRLRDAALKLLRAFAIVSLPAAGYVVYVAPVFLQYGGAGCLSDERRNETHHDYIFGLRWVKWRDTVVCGIDPPTQDEGNQDDNILVNGRRAPLPIPPDGEWQKSHADAQTSYWPVRLDYLAATFPGSYHFRIGWRWDNIDNIFVFSISVKK